MRLWHKDLLPYLPKQQITGQWRELNSLFKNHTNHILINFVYDYEPNHLLTYTLELLVEMGKRGYKHNGQNIHLYFGDINKIDPVVHEDLFKEKMNDRYLKQCLFNLEEKHDCGGINNDEWNIIKEHFKDYLEGDE